MKNSLRILEKKILVFFDKYKPMELYQNFKKNNYCIYLSITFTK